MIQNRREILPKDKYVYNSHIYDYFCPVDEWIMWYTVFVRVIRFRENLTTIS